MTDSRSLAARRVATLLAAVMIAQQVAAKTTRDALFLSQYNARDLLFFMLGTPLLSGVAAVFVARGMARFGPKRLAPVIFFVHGLFFFLEWGLSLGAPERVAAVLYLHVGALGACAISAFWSTVNEAFDPHSAKKAVAFIGGGGTVGGVIGGLAAERVTQGWGVEAMLPSLALLNLLCAFLLLRFASKSPGLSETPSREPFRKTLASLAASSFLRKIAALVALSGLVAAVLDFTMKAAADSAFHSAAELSRFFALFYTATSVLTFAVQAGLATRVLRRIGLSATIALLPLGVLASSFFGAALHKLWSTVLTVGLEQVLRLSLFRSGYELLYTPMAPAQKRPAKALIDVAFDRAGGALGAGLLFFVVALFPERTEVVALSLSGFVSVGTVLIARKLHTDYVRELAKSLRTGIVRLGHDDTMDATTRTLANTVRGVDREDLLRQIEVLRLSQLESEAQEKAPPLRPPARLVSQLNVLMEGERHAIGQVLAGDTLHPALVSLSAALCDDSELGTLSLSALRRSAPRITGQLGDLIWDEEVELSTRCRLLRVLGSSRSERAVQVLFWVLKNEDFDLRYHAGQALLELITRAPHLTPAFDEVVERVRVEILLLGPQWQDLATGVSLDPPYFVTAQMHGRAPHALEHLLTLLALGSDRAALRLCLKALCSDDQGVRGTATEYLHSVLPLDLYAQLHPFLVDAQGERWIRSSERPRRSRQSILAELERSAGGD